jgi:protein DGCR14
MNNSIRTEEEALLRSNRGKYDSKQRRLVLSEEDYTGTLTSIITRDYFPALPALNRDAAILKKRSEGDVSSVIAIRRNARQIEAKEELVNQLEETEEIVALHNGGKRKRARPLERETVDGFHQRVTSEDNAEFEENMRREVVENRQRMDLIYQTSGEKMKNLGGLLTNIGDTDETRNIPKDAGKLNLCNTPLLASDYFNAPVERIQCAGTNADGKNKTIRNALFFTPEQLGHSTKENVLEKIDLWPNSMLDDSQIMPPPKSIKSLPSIVPMIDSIGLNVFERKPECLVEFKVQPTHDPNSTEKMIVPSNTRFDYQGSSRVIEPCYSKSLDTGSKEISQLEYDTDTSVTTDLDATPVSISMERKQRVDHKERTRNTFVAMTPTIIPGKDTDSPIVTWGRVASTPLALGLEGKRNEISQQTVTENDDNLIVSSFQLPQENKKEIVAKRAEQLLSKRAECYKQSRNKMRNGEQDIQQSEMEKSRNNKITTVIGRASSLTPAALSLLGRAARNKSNCFLSKSSIGVTPRSSSSFGTALRNSYSSSSNTASIASAGSRKSSTINKATPMSSAFSVTQPASYLVGKRKDGNGTVSTSGLLKK